MDLKTVVGRWGMSYKKGKKMRFEDNCLIFWKSQLSFPRKNSVNKADVSTYSGFLPAMAIATYFSMGDN